jgi:ABC-type nitrate/sulfonate/bicarbonate transport system substrate-binding protein
MSMKFKIGWAMVVIWPAQSSQLVYGVIVCRNDWIAGHPELIDRFLKSLDRL